MTGTQIIKQGLGVLRGSGWLAFSMNSNRYTPRGMKGFTDIIAFRHDVTLVIEVKGDGDKEQPSQKKFALDILPHLGDHIHHFIIENIEEIEDIVEMRMIA